LFVISRQESQMRAASASRDYSSESPKISVMREFL